MGETRAAPDRNGNTLTLYPPLIIDLDGSLLRTDSLHESVAAALHRPWRLVGAAAALATSGRAGMKRYFSAHTPAEVRLMPVNHAVLSFIHDEKATGRKVYLATGADESTARGIMARFAEFDGYFASDGVINLTGERKAARLVENYGSKGFDYLGDSAADIAVWIQSDKSYLATSRPESKGLPPWSRGVTFAGVIREDRPPAARLWIKELRLHQSLKNLLLFLPLLAAHAFGDIGIILDLVAGFAAFTLVAFSVYLINDLIDLDADRQHDRKSNRPLAAGRIRPVTALIVAVVLALSGLGIAVTLGLAFTVVLAIYVVLTSLYSFRLKRIALVDVVVLALLYMVRIFAGSVIAGVPLSFWFTGVTLFLFISLALAKRYTEVSRFSPDAVRLPGRGYGPTDATVLMSLGVASGVAVLLLLAVYIQSSAVALLYPSSGLLWLSIPVMFYWIGNLWLQAARGTLHDDPVVFALRDPASLASASIVGVIFIAASSPVVKSLSRFLGWTP